MAPKHRGGFTLLELLIVVAGRALLAALLLAGPAFAAEPAAAHRSPLEAVKALEKPVTYTQTKIPLGELVQKVAADTGVKLVASADVADEPIAVVVREMPAQELLEQLADLLDYQWTRHTNHGAPNTAPATPTYEIYQDLASQQREAALREARQREVEKRFAQEIRSYAELASRSQEQIQALIDGGADWLKLPPEEQAAFLRTPEGRERVHRVGIARALATPIARELARFVAHLSPQEGALLREGQQLASPLIPSRANCPSPQRRSSSSVLRRRLGSGRARTSSSPIPRTKTGCASRIRCSRSGGRQRAAFE